MSSIDGDWSVSLGDAFGSALLECYHHEARYGVAYSVQERDDGFIFATDVARYFAPSTALSPLDSWACGQAEGRVLDVGCGAGRHSIALMSANHEVVGIDPSPGAVQVCRARGVNAVRASLEDVIAGEVPGSDVGIFDTILMLGNNLGLLRSASYASEILNRLADVVPAGGRLIGSSAELKQPLHSGYRTRNRQRGRLPGQQRLRVRWRLMATEWFDYLALSEEDLGSISASSPWSCSSAFHGPLGFAVVMQRR